MIVSRHCEICGDNVRVKYAAIDEEIRCADCRKGANEALKYLLLDDVGRERKCKSNF